MSSNADLAPFRSFDDPAFAEELLSKLQQAGITARIYHDAHIIDPVISGSGTDNTYMVQIPPSDFTRAQELLEQGFGKGLPELPEDYYLFAFTDKELFEVLEKPDEWNGLDLQLARQLLERRGVAVDDKVIGHARQERLSRMAHSEELGRGWVFISWALAFVLSIVGLFYGIAIATSKKTLPDGSRHFTYSYAARRHGRTIIVVSAIMLALTVVLRFRIIPLLPDNF